MLSGDGQPRKELFLDDGLHLNAKGYALWNDILAPVLLRASR
jgi:lysophospholipase L1-like esterase